MCPLIFGTLFVIMPKEIVDNFDQISKLSYNSRGSEFDGTGLYKL